MKDSALYSSTNILTRVITFLLLPLYTRALSPEDFGVADVLTAFSSLMYVTLALEIAQALGRFYPEAGSDSGRIACASTTLWFSLGVYSVFVAMGMLLAPRLGAVLVGSAGRAPLLRLTFATILVQGMFNVVNNQLRWGLKTTACVATGAVFSIGGLLGTLVTVLVLRWGVAGILAGQLFGAASGLAVGLVFVVRDYRPVFDAALLRTMLKYSIPFVFSSVGVMGSLYISRIAIKEFMTLSDVGLFGIASRIASIMSMLVAGAQVALTPLIYRYHDQPGSRTGVARIFRLFLACSLLVFAALSLFSREILGFMTAARFQSAWRIVPLLVPAALLSSMYIFAPGMDLAKKTWRIAAINLCGAGLNVLLCVILIPRAGVMGAASATLVSSAVVFTLYMMGSQRIYPVSHDWRSLGMGSAWVILAVIAGITVRIPGVPEILLRTTLFLAAAAGVALAGLFRRGGKGALAEAGVD